MLGSFLGLLAHVWACVPLFAAEFAALAALEHLYVRPNGLRLGVGEMSQPFGCTSLLLKC